MSLLYIYFRSFRKIVKSDYKICQTCLSVHPSAWDNLVPTGQIFMKFHILLFSENLSKTFKFH